MRPSNLSKICYFYINADVAIYNIVLGIAGIEYIELESGRIKHKGCTVALLNGCVVAVQKAIGVRQMVQ